MTAFVQDGKAVQIAPLAVYAALKEVHCLSRFRLEVMDGSNTVLHIVPEGGTDTEAAFVRAKEALGRFLAVQGVEDFTCTLSPDIPRASAVNGKFKHIVNRQSRA